MGLSHPRNIIFAISVQGQRCKETGQQGERGRGRAMASVCASFLKHVHLLPAPAV